MAASAKTGRRSREDGRVQMLLYLDKDVKKALVLKAMDEEIPAYEFVESLLRRELKVPSKP